jgi:hypothetical protein
MAASKELCSVCGKPLHGKHKTSGSGIRDTRFHASCLHVSDRCQVLYVSSVKSSIKYVACAKLSDWLKTMIHELNFVAPCLHLILQRKLYPQKGNSVCQNSLAVSSSVFRLKDWRSMCRPLLIWLRVLGNSHQLNSWRYLSNLRATTLLWSSNQWNCNSFSPASRSTCKQQLGLRPPNRESQHTKTASHAINMNMRGQQTNSKAPRN